MRLMYIIACVLMIPVVFVTCSPSAGPAELPADKYWLPDGIVSAGEYSATNEYNGYSIHWRADEEYLYIGISAKTTGWVAMALQPGSRMRDADMVMGLVRDGKAEVYDLYSTGNFGPHYPDTELGGTADVPEYGGREDGGSTTIEFKRKLSTGDKFDHSINDGVNTIIWAYGLSDSMDAKHSVKGYGTLEIR